MVALGAVGVADVVEDGGGVEEGAVLVVEPMVGVELVKEGEGEVGDVVDVGHVGAALFGEPSGGVEGRAGVWVERVERREWGGQRRGMFWG